MEKGLSVYRKNNSTQQHQIEGKLPPQAIELEEAILGAVMLESHCCNMLIDILKPESFYKDANSRIFSGIISLYKRSEPIDILTVTQELKKSGELDIVGGAYHITQLTNRVASAGNAEYHARIVQQKYIARELIRISTETATNAYDEGFDIFDTMESLEKSMTALSRNFTIGKSDSMASLWNKMKEKNEMLLQKKGLSGVPSEYMDIDRVTGGWQNSDLIILAARPAMGKTSLLLNFARNAAVSFDMPGIIFSLEMSALQLATRMFALESNTSVGQFARKGIEQDRMVCVEQDCTKLINSPIWIDDTAGMNIVSVRSKARKMHREKKIKWIGLDYIQLMEGVKENKNQQNREQEISSIARGLKSLAKELDIPVIALSQLSRAVETRGGNKRPQLSDLRESGAIEQDADMVMFIHRPEYYNIKEDENGHSTEGIAEIIFAKHRNGPTGTERLRFIDYLTKFVSIEEVVQEHSTVVSAVQPNKNWATQEDLPF